MNPINATIRTRSTRGGHWRASQYHGPEPKDWPPETFTAAELERLQADPDLEVQEIDTPESSEAAGTTGDGAADPHGDPKPEKPKPEKPKKEGK